MIYFYPYENIIQYKTKEEIKELKLSPKAMENGRVKNIPIFQSELKKICQKNKWLTIFKSKQITLILPLDYNEKEKEVFLVILENIGFRNIKWQKEKLNLKKNKVILEIHKTYLNKIYLKKKKIMIEKYPFYIFHNALKTIEYILANQEKKNRFYFLGSNSKIPAFITALNQKNLYYFQDYKEYIITHASP